MTEPITRKDILRMDCKKLADYLTAQGFARSGKVFLSREISGADFLNYQEGQLLFLDKEITQELRNLWKFRGSFETRPVVPPKPTPIEDDGTNINIDLKGDHNNSRAVEKEESVEETEAATEQEEVDEDYMEAPPLPPKEKPVQVNPAIPTDDTEVKFQPSPDISEVDPKFLDDLKRKSCKPINSELSELTITKDEIAKDSHQEQFQDIINHRAYLTISKGRVGQILAKANKGTYLLYPSSDGAYALMVKGGKFLHNIPIVFSSDFFSMGLNQESKTIYKQFDKLIEHFKNNPITVGGENIYLKRKNDVTL